MELGKASEPFDKMRAKLLQEAEETERSSEHPAYLVCPITQELLVDPVTTPHGHTFERSALEQAVAVTPACPLTRQPLTPADVQASHLRARRWLWGDTHAS